MIASSNTLNIDLKRLPFLVVLCFYSILFSCSNKTEQIENNEPRKENSRELLRGLGMKMEPYAMDLSITADSLFVRIDLIDSNAYFVSPYSKNECMGTLQIDLLDDSFIDISTDFKEIPYSNEETDPWNGNLIRVVRESTKYGYSHQLLSKKDFTTSGTIKFVIEPQCTMETINFEIANKNGTLTIKKVFL